MSELFFSVVVCTYNQENYIAQTLDSIIGQKHDYPYEIIVGEDCSIDGTRDVLLKYKERYPDIIKLILNENNVGVIKNYFNVISHCTGKYIMQCAGDDYWLPGKVSAQIAFMEDNPDVGLCCGNVQKLHVNGLRTVTDGCKGSRNIEYLVTGYDIYAVTICLRRELILEYIEDIKPLEKSWVMEDAPLCLWFAHNSNIYFLNNVLAVYRLSENSITRSNEYNKTKTFLCSTVEVRNFFLDLYRYHISKEELDNEMSLVFARCALQYKQYEEYKVYISKVHSRNIEIVIKKMVGKCQWLFNLCYHYICAKSILTKHGEKI